MKYSLVGPDVFMDTKGNLYKKANDSLTIYHDKYTDAENRYVQKFLNKKGRNSNEKTNH